MQVTVNRAAQLVAAALILTVVTQVAYMLLEASGKAHIAYPIWRMEALAALVVSVLGFVIARRDALVGGCLAAGGIFNLIQIGMGLTMFYQLGYGGEGEPNPVFFPVLGMSFFLYFAAKAAFGIAGLALGLAMWRGEGGVWRYLGLLAALAGMIALVVNAAAMALGMELVFPAGATGTVATFALALALARSMRAAAE